MPLQLYNSNLKNLQCHCPSFAYLLMQGQHHVREACKLKQHKEDELGGEVLPQQLAGSSDISIKVFLALRTFHGVHHQVHQLFLQHRAPLLLLPEEEGSVKG